jgi:predicted signal transduction protein with EAL and GGDEF domain
MRHAVGDAQIVERLVAARARFDDAFQRTVDEVELDLASARPIMVRETLPALNAMIRALDALVAAKSAQANATIDGIRIRQASSRDHVLELSALAVLVALMCAVLITRSITRPLAQTVALAREIADGTLDWPDARRRPRRSRRPDHRARRDARQASRSARRTSRTSRSTSALDGACRIARCSTTASARPSAHATRTGHAMSVLLIDLDASRKSTTSSGTRRRTQLLVQVAGRLTRELRARPTPVARIGGDEFAVLLPATGREARWCSRASSSPRSTRR